MAGSPPELHVSDDPGRARRAAARRPARRAGGSIVLTGGSTPGPAYARAAALEPDWGRVDGLVGRRALRAARRRALELPAREGDAARPARGIRRARSTGSAASCSRPTPPASSTTRSTASSSTSCCSASAPTATSRRSSPGSPQLAVEDRRATSGPAGLEPFVDRVTMTLPTIRSATQIVFLVDRRGEGRGGGTRASRAISLWTSPPASLRLAPSSGRGLPRPRRSVEAHGMSTSNPAAAPRDARRPRGRPPRAAEGPRPPAAAEGAAGARRDATGR